LEEDVFGSGKAEFMGLAGPIPGAISLSGYTNILYKNPNMQQSIHIAIIDRLLS
jgi:hypothetical protein